MREHSVTARLGRVIEVGKSEVSTHGSRIIEFRRRHLRDCSQAPVDRTGPEGPYVVLEDETHRPLHSGKQIVELEVNNAGLFAHGQRPSSHLCSQTLDEFGALEHSQRRPVGGKTTHLETIETGFCLVETSSKSIETLQLLVHVSSDLGWLRQFEFLVLIEEGGDTSTFTYGNYRLSGLHGETLCGAVTGAGLICVDCSVGYEVDVGFQISENGGSEIYRLDQSRHAGRGDDVVNPELVFQ